MREEQLQLHLCLVRTGQHRSSESSIVGRNDASAEKGAPGVQGGGPAPREAIFEFGCAMKHCGVGGQGSRRLGGGRAVEIFDVTYPDRASAQEAVKRYLGTGADYEVVAVEELVATDLGPNKVRVR